MPYLYRSERLAALKEIHLWLFEFDTGKGVNDEVIGCLSKINGPSNIDRWYKSLESKLYTASVSSALNDELDRIEKHLIDAADKAAGAPFILKGALYAQITGSIFSPFWLAAQNFLLSFDATRNYTKYTFKLSAADIFLNFPLVNDILEMDESKKIKLKENIFFSLILSLLNPLKLIEDLLLFTQYGVNRLLEIGLVKSESISETTPMPQAFLKGLVGLAATIIRVPLAILRPFSDILPAIVNNLVIQPVKYMNGRFLNPMRQNYNGGPNLDDPSTLGGVDRQARRRTMASTSANIRLNQVDAGHAVERSERSPTMFSLRQNRPASSDDEEAATPDTKKSLGSEGPG